MPATFDSAADSFEPADPRCPNDELLLEYIPGRLSGAEASSIEAHIRTCPICKSRITTLKERLPGAKEQGEVQVIDSLDSPMGRMACDASRPPSVAPTLVKEHRPPTPRHLGDYELIRCIGRGGMGVVYRAMHTKLKRKVAIKLLPHLNFSDPTAIARLQREMAAAGRVKHPNLVYALDAGERDGIEYLVLEYVDGLDLGKLVAVLGPLSVANACELIRQAAAGLAHIDLCGLVHRDLKPSNLMLAEDGTVKVLDLGLALLARSPDDGATQSGYLLGTADYVAPEQIDDPHHADVRSDLYSLGCALYKLLAGHAPFGKQHETVTSKLHAQRHVVPPAIGEIRSDVPEELVHLLARLLEKDPAARLQNPQELVEALAPLATGADLPALVRQARERGDLEGLPIPNPSQTPPSADASTHALGRTPTPQRKPVGSDRPTWKLAAGLIGVLLLACIAAAALPGVRSRLWGPRTPPNTGTTPANQFPVHPSNAPPAPAKAADLATSIERPAPPAASDPLLAAAQELALPDNRGIQTINVDPSRRMIQLVSEEIQLVKLGDLEPGNGRLSLELHMTSEQGDAGIFLGFQQRLDGEKRWSEAHFIHFQSVPGAKLKPFWFSRDQGQIYPGHNVLLSAVGRREPLPPRTVQKFKLSVAFTKEGIREIVLDDKPFPELLSTSYSRKFDPQSIWGPWGLFNHGSTIRVFQPTLILEQQP